MSHLYHLAKLARGGVDPDELEARWRFEDAVSNRERAEAVAANCAIIFQRLWALKSSGALIDAAEVRFRDAMRTVTILNEQAAEAMDIWSLAHQVAEARRTVAQIEWDERGAAWRWCSTHFGEGRP